MADRGRRWRAAATSATNGALAWLALLAIAMLFRLTEVAVGENEPRGPAQPLEP